MDRRKFITIGVGAAAAGAAAVATGKGLAGRDAGGDGPAMPGPATVAIVRAKGVAAAEGMTREVYRRLVDRALQIASGAPSTAGAVRSIFSPSDTIGFKLNLLAGPRLSPAPALAAALADAFGMAGFPAERLVMWERTRAELVRGGHLPGRGMTLMATDDPGWGYEEEPEQSGEIGSCFSRLLTRKVTALVSVGVVKDHDLSGISCGAKNLYGVIHNPNKYHDGNCDPYLPDLLAAGPVRRTLRLTVLDAATVQCDGGPLYREDCNAFFGGVIAGRDVVAVDAVARGIIEKFRKDKGLKSLKNAGREPTWLATAERRGLGVADPAAINVVEESV